MTDLALRRYLERVLLAKGLAGPQPEFGDGTVVSVVGNMASVRIGGGPDSSLPAVDGFHIPPHLAVIVGDHVRFFRRANYQLITEVLNRNALSAMMVAVEGADGPVWVKFLDEPGAFPTSRFDTFTRTTTSPVIGTADSGFEWEDAEEFGVGSGNDPTMEVDGSRLHWRLVGSGSGEMGTRIEADGPWSGSVFDVIVVFELADDPMCTNALYIAVGTPGELYCRYGPTLSPAPVEGASWRVWVTGTESGVESSDPILDARGEGPCYLRWQVDVDGNVNRAKVWKVGDTEPDWQVGYDNTGDDPPTGNELRIDILANGVDPGDEWELWIDSIDFGADSQSTTALGNWLEFIGNGTWTSREGYVEGDPGILQTLLAWDQLEPMAAIVFEAEIYSPGDQDADFGLLLGGWSGLTSEGVLVYVADQTELRILHDDLPTEASGVRIEAAGFSWANDTWQKLRVMRIGSMVSAWLDDQLVGSAMVSPRHGTQILTVPVDGVVVTSATTSFTMALRYLAGTMRVHLNGLLLDPTSDFAEDTTPPANVGHADVTLTPGQLATGDVLVFQYDQSDIGLAAAIDWIGLWTRWGKTRFRNVKAWKLAAP